MNQTSMYQPMRGAERGPMFQHLSIASLWVIMREDASEWRVELLRWPCDAFAWRVAKAQVESEMDTSDAPSEFDEFCAEKDREQAADDEQREVEASQEADYQSWRKS